MEVMVVAILVRSGTKWMALFVEGIHEILWYCEDCISSTAIKGLLRNCKEGNDACSRLMIYHLGPWKHSVEEKSR